MIELIFNILKSFILTGVLSLCFSMIAFDYVKKSCSVLSQRFSTISKVFCIANAFIFSILFINTVHIIKNFFIILIISVILFIEAYSIAKESRQVYGYMISGVVFVVSMTNVLTLSLAGIFKDFYRSYIDINTTEDLSLSNLTLIISAIYLFYITHNKRVHMENWRFMIHSKNYGKLLLFFFCVADVIACICGILLEPIIFSEEYPFREFPFVRSLLIVLILISITLMLSSFLIVVVSSRNASANRSRKKLGTLFSTAYENAIRDPLTSLFNRRGFEEKIDEFLLHKTPGALFILDLDNFKNINDNFGHPEGDALLVRVANEINQDFRSNDIIGRLGGDEFIIFAPYLQDNNKIIAKAKLLLKHLTFEYENEDTKEEDIIVTTSIGITITQGETFSYTELYESADRALYMSKRTGKNNYTIV